MPLLRKARRQELWTWGVRISSERESSASKLMKLTELVNSNISVSDRLRSFKSFEVIEIGAFKVTPYLVDHSAFDSYAFLIETDNKSIFYTGDFRGHGRKGKLFNRLLKNPLHVDILMTEGTTVGPRSDEIFVTESELEEKFINIINETKGTIFVTAAGDLPPILVPLVKLETGVYCF